MRVLLFGATDLSLAVAEKLFSLGVPVAGVLHVGRSFPISYRAGGVTNWRFADLASWAEERGIPNEQYDTPADASEFVTRVQAQFGLVAGWYHMVPRSLRSKFSMGCAGLHASLLPKFRGGAPLNWALLAQESSTGVSLFELGDGVDDGPLYGQRKFAIRTRARISDLVEEAERSSLALVEECIPALAAGTLRPAPQAGTPTYCLQRSPRDGWIDWHRSTEQIDLLIRAVGHPYPGAYTRFGSEVVYIWDAEPIPGVQVYGAPGQIARLPDESDAVVVTGDGVLAVREATDSSGAPVTATLRRSANQCFDPMAFVPE